jgi:MerR family transcriptional regulator, light-induced transcriptional regulator
MTQVVPSAQAPESGLTIGELARRTEVSPAVLRMWETRHGFPEPRRLSSGHRRYSENDVALIRQVLRRKEAGIRLEIAIAEALASRPPESPSVFAEMRRRHPTLAPQRLRKSTLIALSWAIEDECCAVADSPIIFGGFQRSEFYLPSAPRWRELTRIARSAVVFADHWPDESLDARGPVQATLDPDAPMRREWTVVCDALDSTACLAAWELPGQTQVPDRQRIFEAVWTLDPAAVRSAAVIAAGIATRAGVVLPHDVEEELDGPLAPRTTTPAAATALFNRVVGYVDRLS